MLSSGHTAIVEHGQVNGWKMCGSSNLLAFVANMMFSIEQKHLFRSRPPALQMPAPNAPAQVPPTVFISAASTMAAPTVASGYCFRSSCA